MTKGIKLSSISRRSFTAQLGLLSAFTVSSFYACSDLFTKKQNLTFNEDENILLAHVLGHLFPSSKSAPGSKDINATGYINWVLQDKYLKASRRKILWSGIGWTEETAQEMYGETFINLSHTEKEAVLRDVESYSNGKTWLALLLRFTFEALLGDPVYGINTNQVGWQWLGHRHGIPRPTEDKIYGRI